MRNILRLIFLVLIVNGSVALSESDESLFTASEIIALHKSVEELRQKQRLKFGCKDNEAHEKCIVRHCNIKLPEVEEDDLLGVLSVLGKYSDEEIKCILVDSEYAEAFVSVRRAFREGLLKEKFGGKNVDEDPQQSGSRDDILRDETDSPALTNIEIVEFRKSIEKCWVVDKGSPAGNVRVTVAFSMAEDGKVIGGSIYLVFSTSEEKDSTRKAFAAARRAILRCQTDGYNLPKNKYKHWRNVEIDFDPYNKQ